MCAKPNESHNTYATIWLYHFSNFLSLSIFILYLSWNDGVSEFLLNFCEILRGFYLLQARELKRDRRRHCEKRKLLWIRIYIFLLLLLFHFPFVFVLLTVTLFSFSGHDCKFCYLPGGWSHFMKVFFPLPSLFRVPFFF